MHHNRVIRPEFFCNYSLGKNLFSIVRSDTACKKFLFGDYNNFSLRKKREKGEGGGLHPGGYSWESLVGVCRSDPPNPDPISDQKISFLQKMLYHYYLD